jgi:hypothetical protein
MRLSLYASGLSKSIWYSPGYAQQAHAQTRLGSKSKVTHIATENRGLVRTFMSLSFRHPPGRNHTLFSMFFIAAFTSGSGFSWPDPADFFCGFAKAPGAFANRKNAAIAQIQLVRAGMIFSYSVVFGDWTIPKSTIDEDGLR